MSLQHIKFAAKFTTLLTKIKVFWTVSLPQLPLSGSSGKKRKENSTQIQSINFATIIHLLHQRYSMWSQLPHDSRVHLSEQLLRGTWTVSATCGVKVISLFYIHSDTCSVRGSFTAALTNVMLMESQRETTPPFTGCTAQAPCGNITPASSN